MKGLIESFDVFDEGDIDLSPNWEFSTFLKAELIIKSDSLNVKKIYNQDCYENDVYIFLFKMAELLTKEENVKIETHEYAKKADKVYVKVNNYIFKDAKEAYFNINK